MYRYGGLIGREILVRKLYLILRYNIVSSRTLCNLSVKFNSTVFGTDNVPKCTNNFILSACVRRPLLKKTLFQTSFFPSNIYDNRNWMGHSFWHLWLAKLKSFFGIRPTTVLRSGRIFHDTLPRRDRFPPILEHWRHTLSPDKFSNIQNLD